MLTPPQSLAALICETTYSKLPPFDLMFQNAQRSQSSPPRLSALAGLRLTWLIVLFTILTGPFIALAQNGRGMTYTAEEVALWRQRVAGVAEVNYTQLGDAGLNMPGDWERVRQEADQFVANPTASIWQGSLIQGANYPTAHGSTLQSAAFCYLIYRDIDPTLANRYGNAVRTALLAQIAIANANIARWTISTIGETGTNESRWITRLLLAYDYMRDNPALTAADHLLIRNWFLAAANLMANHVHQGPIGECFPRRLQNDYSVVSRDAKPNGESYGIWPSGSAYPDRLYYTHRNANGSLGNRISHLARHYNNRRAEKVNMFGLVGVYFNDANLILHARQYSTEWIRYSVYPDGTMGEYDRNGEYNNPQQGMSYGAINMQQYVMLADVLARRGDLSLYQYQTSVGMHGTQGGNKSLYLVLDKYARNMQGNPAIFHLTTDPINRIDDFSVRNNLAFVWDIMFSIANKFYKSEYLTSIYTRTAPNVRPMPGAGTAISSAGSSVWYPWGGTGAEMPGILFQNGQMEHLVDVYRTTPPPPAVPEGLYVPFVYSRSTEFRWSPALAALRYNLRYRPVGTSTWITHNNLYLTVQPIRELVASTTYEWQVQTVGASSTSAWSSLSYVTTPANCTAAGYITRQVWTNISGSRVTQVNFNSNPNSTSNLTRFESARNTGDNYGQRIHGYVCAPQTGLYTFWVSGDDEAELWLSTDDDPANARRIAFTSGWTNPLEWTKQASQRSAQIELLAGQRYYISALHKEGVGNDHVAVGWQLPNATLERPIPAARLSPFVSNQLPNVTLTAPQNNATFANGSTVRLTANASDPDGTVLRVEFFSGSTKIGESTRAPYQYDYENLPDGTYSFSAMAIDNAGQSRATAAVTVTVGGVPGTSQLPPGGGASGQLLRERWLNVSGNHITSVNWTSAPDLIDYVSIFESGTNIGDNYGQRLSGFITAPTTGAYLFYIAGDDRAELHLSTNDQPANLRRIAHLTDWTNPRQWDKMTSQVSASINLVAGQRYYVEVLHKEGAGGDNLAVGWRLPNGTMERPISGTHLSPAGATGCQAQGFTSVFYWDNIPGMNISDVPRANHNRTATLTSLEIPANQRDDYGSRIRGFLCAPTTGDYTFLISGDDRAEFFLSTDDDPANATRIAAAPRWTNPREFTKYPEQRSVGIRLQQGQRYYFEVIHKEGGGGDHVAVAWIAPGRNQEIIPGSQLSPYSGPGMRGGLVESAKPKFTVFPNPASEYFVVKALDAEGAAGNRWTLTINDASGRQLHRQELEAHHAEASVDMERLGLPTGIYTLVLVDEAGARHALRLIRR